jgi:hypothetical protein
VRQAVALQLNPHHSVLSAELSAILQSFQLIEADSCLQWVVCSDSLVALQLLLSPTITNTCSDQVYGIRNLLTWLNESKIVYLQWVKAALFPLPCLDAIAVLWSHFLCLLGIGLGYYSGY